MPFYDGKKILVTGATGFVGTNLLKKLVERNVKLRAARHKREPAFIHEKIEYIDCDLTRMDDCKNAVQGVDLVFHCAASTSGAATMERTPLLHVTPNIVMNAQLLEAAYFAKVKKFLWLSSSTGYPDTGSRPIKEGEMMEGEPFTKYYFVGWMKRYTEVLCRIYSQKLKTTMPVVVLRPTNIYGEHDDFEFETSHVFAALLRRVIERHDPIEVWGTGEDIRDLIYVGDFVQAMLLAMEKLPGFNPVNIGLGKGCSVKQMLELMLEADGYSGARVVYKADMPTMIPVRLVDTSLSEKLLGFKPTTDLEEGIKRTIAWYKKIKKYT